jgi:hypothetical protein
MCAAEIHFNAFRPTLDDKLLKYFIALRLLRMKSKEFETRNIFVAK